MKKLVTLSSLALIASNAVFAENEDKQEGVMEEVVVTATYRETNLMDTPLSISAVTDKMAEDTGATDMKGLFTLIPGLSMAGSGRSGDGENRFTVRGVTSQTGTTVYAPTMGTVGIYLDGVPVTSNWGPDKQVSGTLFDIDRVEVLKGPQGTLFGEGSQGGTIRYIYKKPDTSGLDFGVNYTIATIEESDDHSSRTDFMLNLPLNENAAVRITGWDSTIGGFIDNETPVEPDYNTAVSEGIRAAVVIEEGNLSFNVSYHNSEQGTAGGVATYEAYAIQSARIPGLPPSSYDWVELLSVDVQADYDWGTVQYLSSVLHRDQELVLEGNARGAKGLDFYYFGATEATDHPMCVAGLFPQYCGVWPGQYNLAAPGTTIPDGRNMDAMSGLMERYSKQVVHEVRLVSNSDGRLRWTAGLFLKDGEDYQRNNQVAGYNPQRALLLSSLFDSALIENPANNHEDFISETAFYGEISYDLTDTFEITAGIRSADIKQTFQRAPEGSTEDTPISPKVVFAWKPFDDTMIYGGYTSGFRPGNVNNQTVWFINTFGAPASDMDVVFFGGDEVDNFELGIKTTFLEGRVQLQAATYHLDWQDMIVGERSPLISFGGIGYNRNSGGAEISGAEFELQAYVTDNLHVRFTGDVNDGKVTRANEYSQSPIDGKLAFAPEHSYSIAIDYTLPLDNGWTVDFYLDNAWVAEQFSTINNDIVLPEYSRANGRITARSDDGKWRVALYATNLRNKEIIRGRGGSGEYFWFDPRQLGLEVGYQL